MWNETETGQSGVERASKMASSKANTWLRKMVDVATLPRIKLNNLQDLPGAKKKVCCVHCAEVVRSLKNIEESVLSIRACVLACWCSPLLVSNASIKLTQSKLNRNQI